MSLPTAPHPQSMGSTALFILKSGLPNEFDENIMDKSDLEDLDRPPRAYDQTAHSYWLGRRTFAWLLTSVVFEETPSAGSVTISMYVSMLHRGE